MPFSLLHNLKLTIPTAIGFALSGYVVSFPLSFLVDSHAASARYLNYIPIGVSVETERIRDLGKLQVGITLGGAVLGVIVAQTTFVAGAIATKNASD